MVTRGGRAQSQGEPGAEAAWKWDSTSYGTQRALWLSFQFPRCPPPRAGGSAAPRAKARQLANLSESALEILIARIVARAGATQTKVHFFSPARSPAYPLGIRTLLVPTWALLAPECCVILL